MCNSAQPKFLDERPQLEAFEIYFSAPDRRDGLWMRAVRGDWMLWVAEKAGVPYEVLLEVALPIVETFLEEYEGPWHKGPVSLQLRNDLAEPLDGESALPNDDPTSWHWQGHRLHAHADVLHALAHLAHGTGHHGAGHPALALFHCQVAALMAYQPEGATSIVSARAEGDRLAKARTSRMVREAMPPPSKWAERWPEVKW